MAREHRFPIGKVDYNRSGRKNCLAVLTWRLENGRFSMCGEIWNPVGTDCYNAGQCVDTVADYFPENAKVQRMRAIWRDWHLNDMKAGTPAQHRHIEANSLMFPGYPVSHYDWAREGLGIVGLNPDPESGYKYGSAWLSAELPPDIVAEIQSWSGHGETVAA